MCAGGARYRVGADELHFEATGNWYFGGRLAPVDTFWFGMCIG